MSFLFTPLFKCWRLALFSFKLDSGELKYLAEARSLDRPERNTLTVQLPDVEEFSTKLATVIQEHYYQLVWLELAVVYVRNFLVGYNEPYNCLL